MKGCSLKRIGTQTLYRTAEVLHSPPHLANTARASTISYRWNTGPPGNSACCIAAHRQKRTTAVIAARRLYFAPVC